MVKGVTPWVVLAYLSFCNHLCFNQCYKNKEKGGGGWELKIAVCWLFGGGKKFHFLFWMSFVCPVFQVLVCPKCTPEGHKDHPWVLLSEVEQQHTDTLQTLVTQGRSKLEKSQEDSQALESALSELQEQTDNAKGLITETFQSYKSLLEKLRVNGYFP